MIPATSQPPAGRQQAAAPAARTRTVTKVHGRGQAAVNALGGVDLDIPADSFTAVIGPSGSGKSTLMHCLAGLDQVSGRIWIGFVSPGGSTITGSPAQPAPGSVLTAIRRVPGVAAADGQISARAVLLGRNGKALPGLWGSGGFRGNLGEGTRVHLDYWFE